MSWTLLAALILGQVLALVLLRNRRVELQRSRRGVEALHEARRSGSHKARLQYPHIDLSRCIGCETCVKACPEEGVLELVHGQAMVVHGARCVGHGKCAVECPVGAIGLTLGDISDRRDIPVLTPDWESTRVPGLFLAGEVTGFALIRTAIEHGKAIADTVARRVEEAHQAGTLPSPAARAQGLDAPRPAPRQVAAAPDGSVRELLAAWAHDGSNGSSGDPSHSAANNGSHDGLPASMRDRPGRGIGLLDERPAEPDIDAASDEVLDLCIVGAGPAGLSCSLQAKAHGLRFVTLEQEQLGGTVSKYPRRKLVMTQPVELPLHGRLDRSTYSKEELMLLWQDVAEKHHLPIQTGVQLLGVDRADGHLVVRTSTGTTRARHVCLALGRRGTPRKLGVPGEQLGKVAYGLLDAQSYTGRRILVVGGGDSAIEAALGLAEQPGNRVTVSYRQEGFSRLKARNDAHLRQALEEQRLSVVLGSQVTRITEDGVHLSVRGRDGELVLDNDEVFVLVGGVPPFELLGASGISFDPAERPAAAPLAEQGTGLRLALGVSLGLALATLAWVVVFAEYYQLPPERRFDSPWHDWLRPSGTVGLAFGVAATLLVAANLSYLVRRSRFGLKLPGSLKAWMTSHVVTGILATLLVVLHGAMAPRNSVGGLAFVSLGVLVVTGAIGRYLYSFVPRAANGRELQLDEVRARLAALSSEWDRDGRGLADVVRGEIDAVVGGQAWSRSFLQRLRALIAGQGNLRRVLSRLEAEARARDIPAEQVERLVELTRQAHRTSLMASHYEELRALLSSWRFLHRWVALLMVLLAAWHIGTALRYAELLP